MTDPSASVHTDVVHTDVVRTDVVRTDVVHGDVVRPHAEVAYAHELAALDAQIDAPERRERSVSRVVGLAECSDADQRRRNRIRTVACRHCSACRPN